MFGLNEGRLCWGCYGFYIVVQCFIFTFDVLSVKDFERLRNLADRQDPNEGMSEIDMVIKKLEEEERENKNQPEPENWTSLQKLLKEKLPIYI